MCLWLHTPDLRNGRQRCLSYQAIRPPRDVKLKPERERAASEQRWGKEVSDEALKRMPGQWAATRDGLGSLSAFLASTQRSELIVKLEAALTRTNASLSGVWVWWFMEYQSKCLPCGTIRWRPDMGKQTTGTLCKCCFGRQIKTDREREEENQV